MTHRTGIIILILLVSVLGLIVGQRYYVYTQEDPDFCSTCHAMSEGFRTWVNSKHSHIICQRCHLLGLLEENKLLIAFVMKGNSEIKEKHGRDTPWTVCLDCHNQEAAQGSLSLRVSHGHARHVFMQNIPCLRCHAGESHDFKAAQHRCQTCHTDKLVHGMGMAGLKCLNCHRYSDESPQMVSTERCFGCHGDIESSGPMSHLKCYECHHPHGKLKMTTADCLGSCHGNETRVGQHRKHISEASMECVDCHRPHSWVIGQAQAKGLCDRCHKLRKPSTFIY